MYQTRSLGANYSAEPGRHAEYRFTDDTEIPEDDECWQGRFHGLDDRSFKVGLARAATDLAKQKEVIVSMVQQRNPKNRSEDLPPRCYSRGLCTVHQPVYRVSHEGNTCNGTMGEGAYVTLDEVLQIEDCSTGEQRSYDILSLLSFCIRQEAERRAVLAKALIESRFLVPPIAVAVDLIVCCGVGEVELSTSSECHRREGRLGHG
jgi:hypothetical protein